MKKTITINGLDDLGRAAAEFVAAMPAEPTVYAFRGQMGAGKTTFITELCRALGVGDDQMGSPSFAIINEYRSDDTAELIYHFDMYRIKDLDEALDIGIEDYLDCGALCLIEWPDVVADLLPDDTVNVEIEANVDDTRTITLDIPE